MDGLLELIREKYPQDVECVLDIAAFLKQRYGYTLSEEEILYLSIHVSRIHQVSVKAVRPFNRTLRALKNRIKDSYI